jgi:hypothetical protein
MIFNISTGFSVLKFGFLVLVVFVKKVSDLLFTNSIIYWESSKNVIENSRGNLQRGNLIKD